MGVVEVVPRPSTSASPLTLRTRLRLNLEGSRWTPLAPDHVALQCSPCHVGTAFMRNAEMGFGRGCALHIDLQPGTTTPLLSFVILLWGCRSLLDW